MLTRLVFVGLVVLLGSGCPSVPSREVVQDIVADPGKAEVYAFLDRAESAIRGDVLDTYRALFPNWYTGSREKQLEPYNWEEGYEWFHALSREVEFDVRQGLRELHHEHYGSNRYFSGEIAATKDGRIAVVARVEIVYVPRGQGRDALPKGAYFNNLTVDFAALNGLMGRQITPPDWPQGYGPGR